MFKRKQMYRMEDKRSRQRRFCGSPVISLSYTNLADIDTTIQGSVANPPEPRLSQRLSYEEIQTRFQEGENATTKITPAQQTHDNCSTFAKTQTCSNDEDEDPHERSLGINTESANCCSGWQNLDDVVPSEGQRSNDKDKYKETLSSHEDDDERGLYVEIPSEATLQSNEGEDGGESDYDNIWLDVLKDQQCDSSLSNDSAYDERSLHSNTSTAYSNRRIEYMVDVFRIPISRTVQVQHILPYLTCIDERDQKKIAAKSKQDPCNAMDMLIICLKESTEPGKWQQFLEALTAEEYDATNQLILSKFEDTSDTKRRLFRVCWSSLVERIYFVEFIDKLFEKKVISAADKNEIERTERNTSEREASVLLLERIPSKLANWFEMFIQVCKECQLDDIVDLLDLDLSTISSTSVAIGQDISQRKSIKSTCSSGKGKSHRMDLMKHEQLQYDDTLTSGNVSRCSQKSKRMTIHKSNADEKRPPPPTSLPPKHKPTQPVYGDTNVERNDHVFDKNKPNTWENRLYHGNDGPQNLPGFVDMQNIPNRCDIQQQQCSTYKLSSNSGKCLQRHHMDRTHRRNKMCHEEQLLHRQMKQNLKLERKKVLLAIQIRLERDKRKSNHDIWKLQRQLNKMRKSDDYDDTDESDPDEDSNAYAQAFPTIYPDNSKGIYEINLESQRRSLKEENCEPVAGTQQSDDCYKTTPVQSMELKQTHNCLRRTARDCSDHFDEPVPGENGNNSAQPFQTEEAGIDKVIGLTTVVSTLVSSMEETSEQTAEFDGSEHQKERGKENDSNNDGNDSAQALQIEESDIEKEIYETGFISTPTSSNEINSEPSAGDKSNEERDQTMTIKKSELEELITERVRKELQKLAVSDLGVYSDGYRNIHSVDCVPDL